jgi:hypothetical protein
LDGQQRWGPSSCSYRTGTHLEISGETMGGSTVMTVAMIVVMVVMMGGMLVGAGWAFLRRRRQRDR